MIEATAVVSTSAISRGRSRSLSTAPLGSKPNAHTQPVSISSSSSAASLTTLEDGRTGPFASTSLDIQREPLVEKAKSVRFNPMIDLSEATASTDIDHRNLNPARDGVFSRIRKIMFRNAAPVAVGAAVGGAAGGYVAANGFELFNSTYWRAATAPKSINNSISSNDDTVLIKMGSD